MNAPFLHHRLQALETLLSYANAALRAHGAHDPSSTDLTIRFLTDAATTYASLGMGVAENESLALRAEVAGARRGPGANADPAGPGRRREAERGVARWALAESGKRLRAEYERNAEILGRARDEVAVLVHHAVEDALVDTASEPASDGGARRIWRVLISEQSTRSAARLLALRVALPDVLLLIDERFTALTTAEHL